jgi:hypothetical protein
MRDHVQSWRSASLAAAFAMALAVGPLAADEVPQGCPEPPAPADGAPDAYWQKALQWLGSDRQDEGKLLLRDLARDYPDTDAGRQAARWLAEKGDLNHDGRTEFIIGSTLMGAYFGYTATLGIYDDIFDDDAWKTAAWMSLGGGVVGLTASALASRYMNLSDSQAMLYNFAGTWGWLNGYLLYDLIWPIDGNEVMVAGATGMGVGLVTSLALWPWLDVDEGAAQMATSSGVFALELASLTAVLIAGERVFRDNESAALLGVLLPANGAVVGGYFLGQKLRWSADDVRFIALGGFLGNLLGGAVVASSRSVRDDPRAWSGITAASVVAGLVAGTLIVQPWDDPAEASRSNVPLNAGVLHVDLQGVHVRPPLPRIAPVEHNGRLGYGIDVTLLTSEL